MNNSKNIRKACGKSGISAALEEYLETIYLLSMSNAAVRVTDISNTLCISKPSANRAVNTLMLGGYVTHEPYGDVFLTEKGRNIAQDIYERHLLIKRFLTEVLGINEKDAQREAASIEHSLSQSTVDKLSEFINSYSARRAV